MGGQLNEDLGMAVTGFLDTTADYAVKNLFARNAQERESLTNVASQLAASGQLHTLPPDTLKSIQKNLGKDLGGALAYQSQLRQQIIGPIRQGVQQFLNQPVQQETKPAQSIASAVEQAQPQAPQTELSQYLDERGVQPDARQQSTMIPAETEARAPTNLERYERTAQLSPLGVAMWTGDYNLGQLQLGGQQVATARATLEYKKMKEAFKQSQPKFGAVTTLTGPDGSPQKVWPMYTPDGGIQMMSLGEGTESDAIGRTIQEITRLEEQLARGGDELAPNTRTRLERRLELRGQALQKQLHKGGVNVKVDARPSEMIFDKNGKLMAVVPAGDKAASRRANMMIFEDQYGGKAARAEARNTMMMGRLYRAQVKRVRELASPELMGFSGKMTRLTESVIQGTQGGRAFLASLDQYLKGGKLEIEGTKFDSPEFKRRMTRRVTGKGDRLQRAIDLLIIQRLKIVDPSVVREGEFEREKNALMAGGFAGFLAGLEESERDIMRRMQLADQQLRAGDERAAAALEHDPGIIETHDPGRLTDEERAQIEQMTSMGAQGGDVGGDVGGTQVGSGAEVVGPQAQATPQAPPQGQPQGEPPSTRSLIIETGQSLGLDFNAMTPTQKHKIAASVNRIIHNNPGISETALRNAIGIIMKPPGAQ